MSRSFDAIVIGVGGMGSSTVYSLAKRGATVLGLEQFSLAHDRGSSHGEKRMIRQAYFEHPNYVPLLKKAYALWDEISELSEKSLFHKCGLLLVGKQTSPVLEGARQSARLHQIPVAEVSSEQLEKDFGHLTLPDEYVGLLEPGAGFLEVENGVRSYVKAAVDLKAQIHFDESVISWTAQGDGVEVLTNKNTYYASKLIVTAGPWTSKVLQDLKVPLQVKRACQFWFRPQHSQFKGSPCLGFDMPRGFFYGFPEGDGLTKWAAHSPGEVVLNPSELKREVSNEDWLDLRKFLSDVVKGLHLEPVKATACMYTLTPDENFVVDVHPQHPQVCFAGGFSGHGYKFAAVMGSILSDLALLGQTKEPIDFLRLRWS